MTTIQDIIALWPAAACVTVAAICKAAADSMAHYPHRWPNTKFWNVLHPGNDKVKRIFNYPVDGWHLANSGMITAFLLAGCWPAPILWYWQIGALGGWFVIAFNFFCNRIFK